MVHVISCFMLGNSRWTFASMFRVEILGLIHSVCRNFRSKVSASIFSVLASCIIGVTGHPSQYMTLQPEDLDLHLVMV